MASIELNRKYFDSGKPLIISASRRTDIPAFFGEWFMEKISLGGVEVPNPFNKKPYFVPLIPEKTAALVFWSKNFKPFIRYLDQLENRGFDNFIFNFTITGHPREFEPNVPPPEITISDFKYLALKYCKSKIFWRFDPILFSELTEEKYYLNKFKIVADEIAPFTERCIFSFACHYKKVQKSLNNFTKAKSVSFYDPPIERKRALALQLGMLAASYNLEFHSCCCEYLEDVPGVRKSHCVDGELISDLHRRELVFYDKPSREGCGCAESVDIGSYGTCKGGCIYCYAG